MLLVIFTDKNFVEQDPPPFVLPYTRFLENIIYVKAPRWPKSTLRGVLRTGG